ncbi:MAG: hypothetical protein KGO49_01325 [Gammaproteobacteria bacterium]|nr:hypothetical protein [Gammaproteobacteria bacterium]
MVIPAQNTLHLLAAAPSHWLKLIPQISAVWHEGDLLLLIAEGAQGFNSKVFNQFPQVAVLDSDLMRLEVMNEEVLSPIKIATTSDWAAWTVQYQRTVTWR